MNLRNRLVAMGLALAALAAGPAHAQCILANPSFEIAGSGGAAFGGWNQFGDVGSVADADHGAVAARVRGPQSGDWAMSGLWQAQDCAPGEQWELTGHVRHPSARPLTGASAARVNVEWRDGAGQLLDYESFVVADAATALDDFVAFSRVSSPAPTGTVTARVLLAVQRAPGEPVPEAHYDQVTFLSTASPTLDTQQWNDFPGGRTLAFGGRDWRVKGPGYYGPGPNVFRDDADAVWVDATGRLHLTLQFVDGNWASTEVVLEPSLGYGDYVLTTEGRLDLLDPQAVLGIFLWQYGPCWDPAYLWWNPYDEIDIEYSRWQDPSSELGQFVAQPYDWPGNLERFDLAFAEGELVSHAMRWLADRVEYRVWRGGADDESPATTVHAWTYTGPHLPRPEQPRLHLNLWKLSGTPTRDQEVVFHDFRFVAAGATGVAAGPGAGRPKGWPAGSLRSIAPNPFNPTTVVRFELGREMTVALDVYDLGGRHVRSLLRAPRDAGEHEVVWRGRDDEGRRVGSGVYLIRLRGESFVETRRVTLLK